MRRRFFLVEMCNRVDRQDDEVWKVQAASPQSARVLAEDAVLWSPRGRRFTVGRVVPARGGTRADKELARDFRTYCTNEIVYEQTTGKLRVS